MTDVNGNTSACSATVTVRDDTFGSCPAPRPNDPDNDLDNDGTLRRCGQLPGDLQSWAGRPGPGRPGRCL
ncbi:MAG: hypothetical protein H6573_06470 [Lewinellaceae bacterium]|nr:hypothetical protein [Lewinellaceae bacterium]